MSIDIKKMIDDLGKPNPQINMSEWELDFIASIKEWDVKNLSGKQLTRLYDIHGKYIK